jgi:hypothetical protein
LSATYRQSATITPELLARDPQNVLLARYGRHRLEAEIIRDAALASAALLSHKQGGPSVFPPQPASVTTEGAYGALGWTISPGEDRYRRSVYTFTKRTTPFAMLNTFDAPSGEACIARREVSNSPLQALVTLNDEGFMEAAQALGNQIAAFEGDDAVKATALFRRILTRPPTDSEQKTLLAFITAQRARIVAKELDPAAIAGPGEHAPDRALWTLLARALLNLDETVSQQ